MNLSQIYKVLKVTFVATILMLLFEILFTIPQITEAISNWVQSTNGFILWIVIWLIMFAQVCIIPIPAYIVLNAAVHTGIVDKYLGIFNMFGDSTTWLFIIVVLSAYMAGALFAYWMGRKWGRKAVEWCAGSDEEYDKWADALNKKGKWWYATSIILPIFPDDLLCLVAGSVKLKFNFFCIVNAIGRFIGLVVMLGALTVMQSANNGGIPWTLIGWSIAVIVEIIAMIICKKKIKKQI